MRLEIVKLTEHSKLRKKMKSFNQFLIALVLALTSQLTLTAHANSANQNFTGEFTETATGHYCYQTEEDAYNQALHWLQSKADKKCALQKATRVSNIDERWHFCSVNVQATFICENKVTCKPEKYWLRCCDKNGCWIE